jgi:Flp pilus assembly protein TadD
LATATRAVNTEPNNVSALMALALSSEQKGDVNRARQLYERALSIDPRFVPAANNLAWLLSERFAERQRAYELARAASSESPDDPHVADTYGWILYRIGENKTAVAVLRHSASRLPDDPTVQFHLGMAARAAGDTATARLSFARAVSHPDTFPEKALARKALIAMNTRRGF